MSKDSGRNVLDKIYERALKVKELVEFGSNIGVAFRELRKIKDFCDVTLAYDVDQIQDHTVIIFACTPFINSPS